jgi:hypothetical protein
MQYNQLQTDFKVSKAFTEITGMAGFGDAKLHKRRSEFLLNKKFSLDCRISARMVELV